MSIDIRIGKVDRVRANTLQSGDKVCNATLIETITKRDGGSFDLYHRVVAWRDLAARLEGLDGVRIMVVGRPGINKWTDKEGNERTDPQTTVSSIETLEDVPQRKQQQDDNQAPPPGDDDGLGW